MIKAFDPLGHGSCMYVYHILPQDAVHTLASRCSVRIYAIPPCSLSDVLVDGREEYLGYTCKSCHLVLYLSMVVSAAGWADLPIQVKDTETKALQVSEEKEQ